MVQPFRYKTTYRSTNGHRTITNMRRAVKAHDGAKTGPVATASQKYYTYFLWDRVNRCA